MTQEAFARDVVGFMDELAGQGMTHEEVCAIVRERLGETVNVYLSGLRSAGVDGASIQDVRHTIWAELERAMARFSERSMG